MVIILIVNGMIQDVTRLYIIKFDVNHFIIDVRTFVHERNSIKRGQAKTTGNDGL